jgi:ribosome biogenesis GTPase
MEGYRIVRALSGFYYVLTETGVVECRARGKLRREGTPPVVGDFCEITRQGEKGTLERLLPRKNYFLRPSVANVDLLVLLASCAIPTTEPFLIDRVLAIAGRQGVPVLIVVNKNDLAPGGSLSGIYERAGFPVLLASAETGEGIEELRKALSGKLSVFTGNSGVGKSSILNRLDPALSLGVGEVSQKLGRGRHTTRCVSLYELAKDTWAADTPGFSAFDTDRMDLILKDDLPAAFPDFKPYLGKCRFPDCAHRKEPGCAVREALERGEVEPTRYQSYLRLYELAEAEKPWEQKAQEQASR